MPRLSPALLAARNLRVKEGKRLTSRLLRQGWRIEEIAVKLGKSHRAVTRYRLGESAPQERDLRILRRLLNEGSSHDLRATG